MRAFRTIFGRKIRTSGRHGRSDGGRRLRVVTQSSGDRRFLVARDSGGSPSGMVAMIAKRQPTIIISIGRSPASKSRAAANIAEQDDHEIFAGDAADLLAGKMRDAARHQERDEDHVADLDRDRHFAQGRASPSGRQMKIERQQADDRAGRRRHARRRSWPCQAGLSGSSSIVLKRARRKRRGDGEDQRREPAEAFDLLQPLEK